MKKKLSIPDSAKVIHYQIEKLISDFIISDIASPLHPDFIKTYNSFLSLFAQYQTEVIKHSNYSVTCNKQCACCCFHWVEDVYSFEAEIIANHLKKHHPENISYIVETCKNDGKEFVKLNKIVKKKLLENKHDKEYKEIDPVDLLLTIFYQLKKPCVFLINNECLIYEIRPLTCRTYISFYDKVHCKPENINNPGIPTYLLNLEENGNRLLDILHEKYNRFNKTGLRAIIVDYLSE